MFEIIQKLADSTKILILHTKYFFFLLIEDTYENYERLKFDNEEEKGNLKTVIKKFENTFVGEIYEVYEAYKYHIRNQETSESTEHM